MAKIVVVDDASFMRGSLEYILKSGGHEVIGLGKSGEEGVQLYKDLRPDAMTMDILMKGGDGLTALKAIKEIDPQAKVVMVTALGQEAKEDAAKKLGAAGYIRKPFKQSEIIEAIESALKGK